MKKGRHEVFTELASENTAGMGDEMRTQVGVIVKLIFLAIRLYYVLDKQEDLNQSPCWAFNVYQVFRSFGGTLGACSALVALGADEE